MVPRSIAAKTPLSDQNKYVTILHGIHLVCGCVIVVSLFVLLNLLMWHLRVRGIPIKILKNTITIVSAGECFFFPSLLTGIKYCSLYI